MAEWKLQCATSLGQTSGINCARSCIKPRWICWEQRTCLTSAFRLCQRYRQAITLTSRPMSEMGMLQQLSWQHGMEVSTMEVLPLASLKVPPYEGNEYSLESLLVS